MIPTHLVNKHSSYGATNTINKEINKMKYQIGLDRFSVAKRLERLFFFWFGVLHFILGLCFNGIGIGIGE